MSRRIAKIEKKMQDCKPADPLTEEQIAERARTIYEQSGRLPGRDLDNWLLAETQLREARQKASRHHHP